MRELPSAFWDSKAGRLSPMAAAASWLPGNFCLACMKRRRFTARADEKSQVERKVPEQQRRQGRPDRDMHGQKDRERAQRALLYGGGNRVHGGSRFRAGSLRL